MNSEWFKSIMSEDAKKRLYSLSVNIISIMIQMSIVLAVWLHYYNSKAVIQKIFVFKGHYFIMALYAVVLFWFNRSNGSLKIGYYKLPDLIFSNITSNIITNAILYLEICLLAYGFPSPIPLIQAMIVQNLFNIAWVYIINKIYHAIFKPHKVLLLFGRSSVKEFLPKIETRKDKFKICESIKIDTDKMKSDPTLYIAIKEKMKKYSTVMLWDVPSDIRNELLKFAYGRSIRMYVMPKISDIILAGSEPMHFFDSPLFLTRSNPLTLEERCAKRIVDIVASLMLIIITSPIMLITAFAIKIQDGGSVLYTQVRCTKNRKEFKIYKFRSMVEDAEKDGVARLASKSDSRVTRIGRFIRATRIDEFPQLINILKGDMSFVGPRPERPKIIEKYLEEIPEFDYRMKVKAGLTGYAQVYGKYNTTPYDKLKLDVYYIEHYSLRLDFTLLVQTIKIMFTPESTEGV